MEDVSRLRAAARLVGAGETTYEELGIELDPFQRPLREYEEAKGRGLRYRSNEREAIVEECKSVFSQ